MCPTWSPKWCPWTSKRTKNGALGTQKDTEFNANSNIQQAYLYFQFYNFISTLHTCFSIPANPCSQQIRSQLVARVAGGRGEASRYDKYSLSCFRRWRGICTCQVVASDLLLSARSDSSLHTTFCVLLSDSNYNVAVPLNCRKSYISQKLSKMFFEGSEKTYSKNGQRMVRVQNGPDHFLTMF